MLLAMLTLRDEVLELAQSLTTDDRRFRGNIDLDQGQGDSCSSIAYFDSSLRTAVFL
jgi:hypothetical protein